MAPARRDPPPPTDADADPAAKITRKLAARLARAAGRPVEGVVFAALDTDKLPLSSFAGRAAARNQEVQSKLAQLLEAIARWETASGARIQLEVRPDSASIALTGPPELFTALAAERAAAALDVA